MTTELFLCPHCREPLVTQNGSYLCKNHHTFDIARQGYVNLLTGRAGTQHGDNRDMIAARRRFLSAGYYAPLVEAVCDTAVRHTEHGATVLDAGCGECHYTAAVDAALSGAGRGARVLGLDISREALSLGGRSYPSLALAVASLYDLPLADGSVDLLLEIFAPHAGGEYARVLRPSGKMMLVIPDARHLFGLKEVLYEKPYENRVQDTALSCFRLLEEISVKDRITLKTDEDLWDLFTMTPYFYRTSPADKEKLRRRAPLDTEISFKILIYQKAE
ncbi:MAG: methyltransferase domain-containing protein [Clostridia bacterium]|nr:methyltransferase domain-containing protein [Clostridia bacterium]